MPASDVLEMSQLILLLNECIFLRFFARAVPTLVPISAPNMNIVMLCTLYHNLICINVFVLKDIFVI